MNDSTQHAADAAHEQHNADFRARLEKQLHDNKTAREIDRNADLLVKRGEASSFVEAAAVVTAQRASTPPGIMARLFGLKKDTARQIEALQERQRAASAEAARILGEHESRKKAISTITDSIANATVARDRCINEVRRLAEKFTICAGTAPIGVMLRIQHEMAMHERLHEELVAFIARSSDVLADSVAQLGDFEKRHADDLSPVSAQP